MTIDRERLIRLLRMTESDRDTEALVAIRKSNALLRAHGKDWADVIDPPTPMPAEPQPRGSFHWSSVPRDGYERSVAIRAAIRKAFPISLAFLPVWIVAELMAVVCPNIYWNKKSRALATVFWVLCGLGLLLWLGAGTWLLFVDG